MDIRPLTPAYAVSPQIAVQDMPAIRQAGFTTIICNRPDPEVPAELQADAIRAAAEAEGLRFVVNPVVPGSFSPALLDAQEAAIGGSDGPVLAYCASGNRSAIVWSMLNAATLGVDGVLTATRNAGYDHSPLRAGFEAAAKAR
ncbi:TIGR01244 family sulfur transferase [Pseudoruegeria sp. SK021]|uniref:TIGR01244 family sulfur transferase n=1 Tax=Pseudoruegeria sp. SK021 TaxID=1933035 RepID=UPI000A23D964|nr:TIGR01244 family sulfur transferase [Pseudoruegeria sp. SK021]OSP54935.1 TIGR01244 family protein [Pseudoruegeria sp. SK021]